MKIGKIAISCLWVGFMMAAVLVVPVFAGLNAQLEVASGKVIKIQANQAVTLDDGKVYYSGGKKVNFSGVKAGDVITLKYFIQTDTKRVFVEYAPGAGSLLPTLRVENPVPVPRY